LPSPAAFKDASAANMASLSMRAVWAAIFTGAFQTKTESLAAMSARCRTAHKPSKPSKRRRGRVATQGASTELDQRGTRAPGSIEQRLFWGARVRCDSVPRVLQLSLLLAIRHKRPHAPRHAAAKLQGRAHSRTPPARRAPVRRRRTAPSGQVTASRARNITLPIVRDRPRSIWAPTSRASL
jgi:hypothetical protein